MAFFSDSGKHHVFTDPSPNVLAQSPILLHDPPPNKIQHMANETTKPGPQRRHPVVSVLFRAAWFCVLAIFITYSVSFISILSFPRKSNIRPLDAHGVYMETLSINIIRVVEAPFRWLPSTFGKRPTPNFLIVMSMLLDIAFWAGLLYLMTALLRWPRLVFRVNPLPNPPGSRVG